jgi:hypothetical protein
VYALILISHLQKYISSNSLPSPFPSKILHVIHTSIIHCTYLIPLKFITLIVFEREFGLNYTSRRESIVDFCQQCNKISNFTKSEEIIYHLNGYKLPQKSLQYGACYAMQYAIIQYLADITQTKRHPVRDRFSQWISAVEINKWNEIYFIDFWQAAIP